ncbi:MAG: hypothetical protein Q9216_003814 [Gyalolechia sp. 2 TL-2023]
MAIASCQTDSKEFLVSVTDRRDSEAGPPLCTYNPPLFPRWPRIIGAAFNIFVFLASVSIIGIVAHSLQSYSGTRGIRFGGTANSWPKDLNLHPAYFIIAASALSVAPTLVSAIVNLRRLKASSPSRMEIVMACISGILLIVWIVGDILQGISERTPKKDILNWACRRRSSPTNVVVSYTSICDEQRAIKYMAILITIAELGSLVSFVTTRYLTRRRSRLIEEPWRVKA